RLNLVDSKTADALMNRFGADASEHLALGTARRGGAKPVLDALADRALFPDLKGGRRRRLRSRLQARLLGEADDRALGRERAGSKERRDKFAAAYARAAELAALADRPAAEIEDAAASAAITPGLRRLLRGLIEQNRAEARREAKGIARVEAALDTGAPLDRDDPEDRKAADAHYEAVAPVWRGLAPKARLALVLPYVQSLGLLPKGLVRRLDAALRGTPADKHAAAGLIGAIARDAPAALADLRPGAVVQAAAINALAELGYSPERAVGRATQIVAGEEAEPDLNDDDDRSAVANRLQQIADDLAALLNDKTGVGEEPIEAEPSGLDKHPNALRRQVAPRVFNLRGVPAPRPVPGAPAMPGPLPRQPEIERHLDRMLTLWRLLIAVQEAIIRGALLDREAHILPAQPPDEDEREERRRRRRRDQDRRDQRLDEPRPGMRHSQPPRRPDPPPYGPSPRDLVPPTVEEALRRASAPRRELPTPVSSDGEQTGLDQPNPHYWSEPATLTEHFTRHGSDFGAIDEDHYARMAREFYNRARWDRNIRCKVDEAGVIRIYEPSTNTLGSYDPEGRTLTFFRPDPLLHRRPTNMHYWNEQPGRLIP
ncbi:MAG: hypothetical protein JNL66_18540, partial [Alphaproteobacteria bacterium]|nr:hypothetical protein [Alphaproteobacteria bacterium]